ncbi:patatin-like phospholipase family protein [Vibrio genomosp. F10 str. 9ZC157]|uniref:Patatin family protein n=2 Tax=Vibrio genomosp. F10 TaxID=723171 RepID=A0A1E5BCH8_9VIBR|nr:patatin-like phospholipase family protein [Vibrio genomosp. F10]OEE32028.1 patatin family protein [Vibrio genomosp. F10 str. ZF-129]OEE92884.1 patatin family protein [Vibrio genomosp. F10 str. 9ZC157]
MLDSTVSALVVQGGGQKGAFAAGVLDQFKRQEYDPFSLYLGTSAGALNIAAFIAGQTGLALDFIMNYTTNQRFFDFNKFVNKQQPMDLDWAFQFVESGEFPLDIKKGKEKLEQLHLGRKREALACVTHVEELKDYYYPIFEDNWFDILRATSAIPVLYFDDIEFDGATWVDGGVTSTIPVHEAYRRGATELVVITTEPIMNETPFVNEQQLANEKLLVNEKPLANENQSQPKPPSQFSLGIESGFDQFVEKYGLVGHVSRLNEFHQQFSQAVERVKSNYPSLAVPSLTMPSLSTPSLLRKSGNINWVPEVEKLANLLKEQSKKGHFSGGSSKKMEMLVSHYLNHESVKEFMNRPPEGIVIHEISPANPLSSRGLLSGKDDILSDYQQGLLAGKEFIINQRSQIESRCSTSL